MGESVMEGTVIKWLVKPGDTVEDEDSIIEIATDKVDTEIPCPYAGKIVKLLCAEGDVVQIGKPIALIETEEVTENTVESKTESTTNVTKQEEEVKTVTTVSSPISKPENNLLLADPIPGRFYSPLVMNIAKKEEVPMSILERINGSGKDSRVTKKDILAYLENKDSIKDESNIQETLKEVEPKENAPATSLETIKESKPVEKSAATVEEDLPKIIGNHEIVEMDRTRQIIAKRMLESKKTSAHVTSIVEADVSNIVYWRNRWKTHFKEKENTLLTFTPIFIEAVVRAIKDYPKINASVYGTKIIYKKDINIGIAVALPDGNLVVPVIKKADQLNIVGLTQQVNDLAKRARKGKLKPQDLEGGTYTVSNVGSFGNLIGTPILVQPQVGILALGAVVKKAAVIETPYGDTLGIRHQMFLSHSYDHRIVDGSLGGMFVRRVADYLEKFDLDRKV